MSETLILGFVTYGLPVIGFLLMALSLAVPLFSPDSGPLGALPLFAAGMVLVATPVWGEPVAKALVNLLADVDWRLFTTVFLAVALALILFGRRLFRRAES